MAKYYIPNDRKHNCVETKELFESIKKDKDSFMAFCYGLAINDEEYFVLNGQNACVKCYFENGKPFAIIKNDVSNIGFTFFVQKFNLKTQFNEARKTLRALFGLKDKITFDMLSRSQEDIISRFRKELINHIANEKIVNNTRLSFYSLYDDQFSPFWFVIDENGNLIFKYKNIAPVSFEKEGAVIEIEKNQTAFNDAVYRAKKIIFSLELYENIKNNKCFESLVSLPQLCDLSVVSNPYVIDNMMVYELNRGKSPVSIEIRNNNNVLTVVPKICQKDKGYFEFTDEGLIKAFEIVSGVVISSSKEEEKTAIPTDNQPMTFAEKGISQLGKDFLEFWRNLSPYSTDDDVQLAFDLCDELPDEDFDNVEIQQAYEKLLNPALFKPKNNDSLINIVSTRSIYVREDMISFFKNNEFIEPVLEKMRTLPMNELYKYFKTRRLVYIDGFLKIRISNTRRERIIFVTGDRMEKNSNNIYIYEFNEHHDFSHLKKANFKGAKYELLAKNVKLDENQEALSESFDVPYKPLICTGCAGSGKTLISVQMYKNIVDELFDGESTKVSEFELIYLTYNQYTVNSVRPLLLEKVSSANAKTIEEYFKDIVGGNYLSDKNIVNEENFFDWWNNDKLSQITDFKKKNALLDYKKNNLARYAYTFFRGFFKGSLYKMQITFEQPHLSRTQFLELIRSKNEPLDSNEIAILFDLFELYQKYLETNNLIDDNDLARMVSTKVHNGISNQYQRIIVDEVQDLTEVQLDAIIKSSSDKRKLYFFGDQNQSINPTLFDISTIQRCLMANLVNEVVEPYKMNKSYRVGPLLADYINSLTEIINKKIGSSGDPLETSALTTDDSKWGYKAKESDNAEEILLQAFSDAKTIVIVPDTGTIDDLVKKYGDVVKGRAVTIYDSKGLEWDKVVLYNMLSFNNDKFVEILTDKAYNSTLHRMIFNQFYVGCTRAHVFFVVIESNVSNLVEDTMLNRLIIAPSNVISADNSSESWALEGQRLFAYGEYKLSRNALLRAKDEGSIKLAEVCRWMLESNYTEEHAMFCKDNKLYKEARTMYQKLGNNRLAKLMDSYLGANLSEEDIKELVLKEKLSDEDVAILNKNNYFDETMRSVNELLNRLEVSTRNKL